MPQGPPDQPTVQRRSGLSGTGRGPETPEHGAALPDPSETSAAQPELPADAIEAKYRTRPIPPGPGGTYAQLPRRRSASISLVLLGAAAVCATTAAAIDVLSQTLCDPTVDPQCPPHRQWSYWGLSSPGYRGSYAPTGPFSLIWPQTRQDSLGQRGSYVPRGGFGTTGRFFSGLG